jgi:hypothetical protein
MELLGDVGQMEASLVCLDVVLILTQDKCTVYAGHTIGLEIILYPPDDTPT